MFQISEADAFACCSSREFALRLSQQQFVNFGACRDAARQIWWAQVGVPGWLEAFAAHPQLGDKADLGKASGAFGAASQQEQSAAAAGSAAVLQELREWNTRYRERFGHIFIACAAGKPAEELLAMVKRRYELEPSVELGNAANEQMKITLLRLQKLLSSVPGGAAPEQAAPPQGGRSPVTTHVLDIRSGRAAPSVPVELHLKAPGSSDIWELLGASQTDGNGRIGDLLASNHALQPGTYRLRFDVAAYEQGSSPTTGPGEAFFPRATVEFRVEPGQEQQHFHVPLTYAPYGYSTYRGT